MDVHRRAGARIDGAGDVETLAVLVAADAEEGHAAAGAVVDRSGVVHGRSPFATMSIETNGSVTRG
jgi:hypothetical protein